MVNNIEIKTPKEQFSREKLIEKIQNWKKENIETGERLKKYEGNTYPSFMEKGDWPIWKYLASDANFELLFTTYTSEEEMTVDFIIEKMLDSILRKTVSSRNLEGLKEKEVEEKWKMIELKNEWKEKSEGYYKELINKKNKIDDLEKTVNKYHDLTDKQVIEISKLENDLKNLEKVITETLLQHRQLTEWEYMQKLFSENTTWKEDNKVLVSDLIKEIKKGEWSDIIIEIVKYWETRAKAAELDAETHLEALNTAKEWRERQLTEVVGEKLVLLDKSDAKFKKQEARTRELEKLLEESEAEKSKLLEKQVSEIKKWESRERELQRQLDLATKPSPKLPSKFKIFKENIKTGFQKLVKREKHQKQELVAGIEVPTK